MAVPIARTHRTRVVGHAVLRVVLTGGEMLEISGGHPTADGRRFDALTPGGTYFVSGAWVGSTLYAPAPGGYKDKARRERKQE